MIRPRRQAWLCSLVVAATCYVTANADDAQVATDGRGTDYTYALLRATQDIVRGVAANAKSFLVRIDTVGGTQPRLIVATPDDTDVQREFRRMQNQFRDLPGSQFQLADGSTTGIIYSADGYIITSSFNFVREPLLISVTFADGRRMAADLVARDQVRKLALLKVDAHELPTPHWKSKQNVRVGEWAAVLGMGFGGTDPSVTLGIVSARNRMLGNAIQTDAKLSPANYGGPACDVEGQVIGMAVPMAQRAGELAGTEMYDCGVGFLLPTERIHEIVEVLKTGRSFYRGWLGMQIDPSKPNAVVVGTMADPSPMLEAGVHPGDRIVAVQGVPISHYGQMVKQLYMIPAGEEVSLRLMRGEQPFDITATLARGEDLGSLPDQQEPFDPSEPLQTEPDKDHNE